MLKLLVLPGYFWSFRERLVGIRPGCAPLRRATFEAIECAKSSVRLQWETPHEVDHVEQLTHHVVALMSLEFVRRSLTAGGSAGSIKAIIQVGDPFNTGRLPSLDDARSSAKAMCRMMLDLLGYVQT